MRKRLLVRVKRLKIETIKEWTTGRHASGSQMNNNIDSKNSIAETTAYKQICNKYSKRKKAGWFVKTIKDNDEKNKGT